jgi:ABC-type polysaccharide/polyol phosphate transport system ATPase subunit
VATLSDDNLDNEVLAVGDAEFQKKAISKMKDLPERVDRISQFEP